MAGTLEKLLSIQGAEDQLSIETLTEPQKRPSELEEAREGIPPPPPPIGPSEALTGANRGIDEPPPGKAPPDMMEAWREAFRIFSHYAPLLRAAAATDGEMNEEAGRLFCEALPRVVKMCEPGGDAAILGLRVYDMLDDVWKEARKVDRP